MKLIELHILQSFPVSCLNRDDLNSPKTAIFGGVNRARVSSQSWKRAIRLKAREMLPECFGGVRTKNIKGEIEKSLESQGIDINDKKIQKRVEEVNKELSKDTLIFLSRNEINMLADLVKDGEQEIKSAIKTALKNGVSDSADIALFGRMVATNTNFNVEAASMFSHAISTSKISNDIDFFTAVDDCQSDDDIGASHMGTLEFNSATYYRYTALNVDQLKDNLKSSGVENIKDIVNVFIRACLLAVPQARKTSMNADTLPSCVIGVVKENGQPVQLVNAFENPVKRSDGGSIAENSAKAMKKHLDDINRIWGFKNECEVSIPEKTLSEFIEEVMKHV